MNDFVTCDMCDNRRICAGDQRCVDGKPTPSHKKGKAPGNQAYRKDKKKK
jgi:hypothetical protein